MKKGLVTSAVVAASVALPLAINPASATEAVNAFEEASTQKIVFRKRKKGDKIVIPDNPVDLHCEIYPENCGKN